MQSKKVLNSQWSADYEIVEKAIKYLEANHGAQPSLASIASHVNLSEFHFQRLFSRWVGISPKRFLQFLTKEYAKKLLDESKNILDVAYDAGLSSPGRLHDLFIHCEAVTPGEYKSKGMGIKIIYGFSFSPFGTCMIANTKRGICALKFVRDKRREELVTWLQKQWPRATLKMDNKAVQTLSQSIFRFENQQTKALLHLYVKGTNFQIKVWEALIKIPFGKTVTYQDIARYIGVPGGNRAVGTAIGKNPVPFLIPCHRVIRKMGDFGNYGEGRARKKALIGWEAAKRKNLRIISE
ncbi:MAG: methylated-DNA--[protein]-cysteine S-methyltransferase [Deltaproteobacteria bacterium]|nr:methylated-DNA--[protein]-cysteine S-methyltransferase [Deltaproteobacteria bacterium]